MASARAIKGLGEVAFRVEDLDGMIAFYESVVGLELMNRDVRGAFFRIANGFRGHTQVLALFDRSGSVDYQGLNREQTTVDHFALEIALDDFLSEKARLESLGIQVETAQHAWVHWRSLYFRDPEGNQIEFVCYDKTI
jgi:catechol-2,3-dioxygenase